MLLGLVLLAGGIALIVCGAEWFTDGALRTAAVMAVSPFAVGLVVSGLEPENLTTGVIAALERLPQIALGTVIGSAVFLLTAALGVSLLLVPMAIRIPPAASWAMLASAAAFALSIWDGEVTRVEGAGLLGLAVGFLIWLYRASPVFLQAERDEDGETESPAPSRVKAPGLLVAGVTALLVGAEGIVRGVDPSCPSPPAQPDGRHPPAGVTHLPSAWRSPGGPCRFGARPDDYLTTVTCSITTTTSRLALMRQGN